MIYEFKSQATGTVVMTREVAEMLLDIIGKQPGPTGIITVEQMPAALARLQDYVPEGEERGNSTATPADDADPDNADEEPPVPLKTRAYPLIEMIREAHKGGKDITWGV